MFQLVLLLYFLGLQISKCVSEVNVTCSSFPQYLHLNDTTELGTSLFSLPSSFEFTTCPLQKYFSKANGTVILERQPTDYCGELDCSFKCTHFLYPRPQPETLNGSLTVSIRRNGNYSIHLPKDKFQLNVSENARINSTVPIDGLLVTIPECQEGTLIQDNLKFELIKSPGGLFRIDAELGKNSEKLTINKNIDYEVTKAVTLILQATLETKDLHLTTTASIEVFIQDIDDNPPAFDHPRYDVKIPENDNTSLDRALNITPEQIHAFDQDKGINEEIVYAILNIVPNAPDLFVIGNSTGEIYVKAPLDRDSQNSYAIVIKAVQQDKTYSSATVTLFVTVIDVDDNLPVFDPVNYTVNMLEHSPDGSYITQVKAKDNDLDANANFTYGLVNGSNLVSLTNTDGVLRVGNQVNFDRENYKDGIIILIQTLTGDNKTGYNTATVTIHLQDVNDHNPVFDKQSYNFKITSAPTIGQVIEKVNCTDDDTGQNANITYNFVPAMETYSGCEGDQAKVRFPFEVNKLTGELSIALVPLTCVHYRAALKACDNPVITSQRCNIAALTFTTAAAINNTSVTMINQTMDIIENAKVGAIVGKLQCHGFRYIYFGDYYFGVQKSSGFIITNGSLDRETTDYYHVTITVEDYTGTTLCQINVTIQVLDANDNAPVFTHTDYSFDLEDDHNEIGRVLAYDNDTGRNGLVTYSIQSSRDYNDFTINASTGVLELGPGHHMNKDIFQLLVVASDNGEPILKSFASVFVSRLSLNEYTVPLFTPLTIDEIAKREGQLEMAMSKLLEFDVNITHVQVYNNKENTTLKSVIHLAGSTNTSTHLTKVDLQRRLLENYEAVRALFYTTDQDNTQNGSKQGLRPPEIALIVMAAIILIGAIIAIIIINKQFSSHKKYRRLYENLTRNSSIYESQEIKINMDEETSDYNGSLKTEDLEQTNSKTLESTYGMVNPLYENGTEHDTKGNNENSVATDKTENDDNTTQRIRTNSEQALDSLHRLSDMLDREENNESASSKLDTINPESGELTDEKEPEKSDVANVANDIKEPLSELIQAMNINNLVGASNSDDNTHIQMPATINDEAKDFNIDLVNANSTESLNISSKSNDDEPNPDYDIKQVRFSGEVLDTDDNKIEPLKEEENKRKLPRRMTNQNNESQVDDVNSVNNNDTIQTVIDASSQDLLTPDTEEETDEPGWVEEEINIPNSSMNMDDNGQTEQVSKGEMSTHF